MRHLLTVALLLWAAPLAAQEFTTDAAKAAQAAYETDLQAAKEKYAAALDDAAKVAVEAGELDEVVRIKDAKQELSGDEGDPIVSARRQLENTEWTFNRPGDRKRIAFHSGGKVVVHPGGSGVWEMLEPRVGAMKLSNDLFMFRFNEQMSEFEVIAYARQKTNFSHSTKIKDLK